MRTLYVFALVAAAWVLATLTKLDETSKWTLALVAWLLGLAICRPRWLRLKGVWFGDDDSSRVGAAITAAIAGVAFGALLGWRLVAIHRARGLCLTAVAAAAPGHAHTLALLKTIDIPLGDLISCAELLDR